MGNSIEEIINESAPNTRSMTDILREVGAVVDEAQHTISDILKTASAKPQTKSIPRGRFDPAVFVREGGDYKVPPYLDIATSTNGSSPVALQRCFIDCTLSSSYKDYWKQANAAMTACALGDFVNGNVQITMGPANNFATTPEYLLEWIDSYCFNKIWINAAACRNEADFIRIRREASEEAARREKIHMSKKEYSVLSFVVDTSHDLKYPSACNVISRQGCGYRFIVY